jgi:hypothetical protein
MTSAVVDSERNDNDILVRRDDPMLYGLYRFIMSNGVRVIGLGCHPSSNVGEHRFCDGVNFSRVPLRWWLFAPGVVFVL